MSKITSTFAPSLNSANSQDLRFNDATRVTLVPAEATRKAAVKSVVEQAVSLNPAWDRFDRAAVRAVARHAASIVVTRDALRLLDTEGKTIAWVNKNHMDFSQVEEAVAPIHFSTHRSQRVAA